VRLANKVIDDTNELYAITSRLVHLADGVNAAHGIVSETRQNTAYLLMGQCGAWQAKGGLLQLVRDRRDPRLTRLAGACYNLASTFYFSGNLPLPQDEWNVATDKFNAALDAL
jgi:hypothetical protein